MRPKCPYNVVLYIQSVLIIMYCFVCKVCVLFTALYAARPYYTVLYATRPYYTALYATRPYYTVLYAKWGETGPHALARMRGTANAALGARPTDVHVAVHSAHVDCI